MKRCNRSAFTLVELLVTIAVVALLAALTASLIPQVRLSARKAASLSNLRQLGAGLIGFASENENRLPGRVTSSDKWPRILLPYVGGEPKVYAEVEDPHNYIKRGRDPLANNRNNTSYILNGFNDVGAFEDETVTVSLLSVQKLSETILMAAQSGTGNFYMDFLEGNNRSVLNLSLLGNGANYLFADGSAQFLTAATYDDRLWLVDKTRDIPQTP